MTKKLAIFCDGTWNDLSLDTTTNVVRLAKCVAAQSATGTQQIVYYDEGVGVGSNVSWLVDGLTKLLGGALGRGLDRKIEAAYRFLVLNYEPGDEIYVFGFSRGAYTARSLCGLIRKCGILRRSCFNKTPDAMALYRSALHPASPEMVQFRQTYAHPLATGSEDRQPGAAKAAPVAADRREQLFQYRPVDTYRVMFLGIWDTVGELGVPSRLDFLRLNRRYVFHDTSASSLIASLRHGIAANEKRGVFDVTLVDNLDVLNNEWSAATGYELIDERHLRYVPYAFRPFQQRWFPGDHCSVGGGYAQTALSSAALLWMAEGAEWAGLAFNHDPDDEMGKAVRLVDPCATLGAKATTGMPAGKRRRDGPPNLDAVADPTRYRHAAREDYRPPNLTVLMGVQSAAPIPTPPPGYPPS